MPTEQLTRQEFNAHVENGTFRLAFVGMSNAGKSFRSKVLQKEMGFLWYHVDEEIQKALKVSAVEDLSHWLGYPASPGYAKRERQYLELEDRFTKSASMQTGGKNFVFDTTGSVVHLPEGTRRTLRENCLVVHLDVGEESIADMVERFFKNPKPVAWNGYFSKAAGESEYSAFRRCYPVLLQDRLRRYRILAHVNVPAREFRETSGLETLRVIRDRLIA